MQGIFRWGFVLGGCTNICGAILLARLIGSAMNLPILYFKLSNFALKLDLMTLVRNSLWNERFIPANGDLGICCDLTVELFSYSANISRNSKEILLRFWRWPVTFELNRNYWLFYLLYFITFRRPFPSPSSGLLPKQLSLHDDNWHCGYTWINVRGLEL